MIEGLVEKIELRFGELEASLGDPAIIGDRAAFEAASRAYSDLEEPARLARRWRRAVGDELGAKELLADAKNCIGHGKVSSLSPSPPTPAISSSRDPA